MEQKEKVMNYIREYIGEKEVLSEERSLIEIDNINFD